MPRKKSPVDQAATPKNAPVEASDSGIMSLGKPHFDCPKERGHFVSENANGTLVYISKKGFENHREEPVFFEEAGPRRKIFFDPPKTKVAIVTCGGVCPGTNDVIRSIVMDAHHNYGVAATLGIRYGFRGFIPECRHDVMELTPDSVAHIHEFGGTLLGSSRGPQSSEEIVDALERMNINILIIVGGVGSMRAADKIMAEIHARGLKIAVICVPKTVDNDVSYVSCAVGFRTAVEKATEAIACAHIEAEGAPYGIGLVKLMGRYSGFIAAEACMGLKHVNLALLPEERFELRGERGFLPALEKRLKDRGHCVVVAAEGAGQHLLPGTEKTDASGNPILGDICGLLQKEIKSYFKETGLPVTMKYIDPSYIIRSVPANTWDAIYGGFLGQHALNAGMAGKTGLIISNFHDRYVHVPLSLVIRSRKRIDPSSHYWWAVRDATGQPPLS